MPFTLSHGERFCFNITVIDDNKNELLDDYHTFLSYIIDPAPVGSQFIPDTDRIVIRVRDNEPSMLNVCCVCLSVNVVWFIVPCVYRGGMKVE